VSEPGIPYYVWLIAGLALCAAETQVPGASLIWIGMAALIIGANEFFAPTSLPFQLLSFAALAAVLALIGRRAYGSIDRVGPSLPASRAHALIGREFFLDDAIARGFGTIRVDDSVWRVAGEDMPSGTKVRVVAIEDGVAIKVEKA
jgi:membrane protein implicated in regulation of membrane protease activity